MSGSTERKRKSGEHAQAADVQDASACEGNIDFPEKRMKTEPVVKSEPYESDGNECDSPPPTHGPEMQASTTGASDPDVIKALSTDEGRHQTEEGDECGQLRARATRIADLEAQTLASQQAEKDAKDALDVEVTKSRMLSDYIIKLEARIRELTQGAPQQSRKTLHKAELLTQAITGSWARGTSAGTKHAQNVKCLTPKADATKTKTVIIKWPRTYATIDTQTDGVHFNSATVQTDAIEQTPVAVSESAVQTETATAPSSNLRDASAQTVRMANVDVQTDTIATSFHACSQTTVAERTEAAAQTDGTVQDYGQLLTKARRHIAHLLQASLDDKKDLMRGSCQLQLAKQKSDKLLSKISRLKAKLLATKTEVSDLSARRDHFEMELFAVDLLLAEANDTIYQLTGDLASAYDSNEELEELLDARILEIVMLQENHATEVESLQKSIRDKSLELAALNAILNDVALEKEQALTELSDQVLQKVAELERLSARLSDVEWDRDQCREKWRAEVEHLERELQRMQDELMPRSHDAHRDSGQSWRRAASEMLPSYADVKTSRIHRYLRRDGTDECAHESRHTFFR